ncbi:flagellar biosynthetic protein FliR [candidate division KSB1 bacterium]
MNQSFHQLIVFMLAFARVATILAVIPVFGYRAVPVAIKAGLAGLAIIAIFPIIDKNISIPVSLLPFFLVVLKEVAIGLVIGFSAQFIFAGVQYAGEIVGIDIGFGIVNIVDPSSGEQVSIIAEFKYILVILIFLTISGHHFFMQAIKHSYLILPINTATFPGIVMSKIIEMSRDIFSITIKIAGPAIITLFIANFIMGIIARTVPQMNIFIVGFPLKISVGLIIMILSMPLIGYVFIKLVEGLKRDIVQVIEIL